MKKRKKLILCGILILIAALTWLGIRMTVSALEYRLMDYEMRLESQIQREEQVYSQSLFESCEIKRSRYSLYPDDWVFLVKLTTEDATRCYTYSDRVFTRLA